MNAIGAAGFTGTYDFSIIRDGKVIDRWAETNLIPTEGLNFILNVLTQSGVAKINTWYLGIGTGNYTATAADANTTIGTAITETVSYVGAARKPLTLGASTVAATTATSVTFECSVAGPITITNAIVSSTVTQASGTLLSSLKLGTAKSISLGDQLVATFSLTAASV